MPQQSPAEPAALCECGCGEPAPIAKVTCTRDGRVKGQPQRFIAQHHNNCRTLAERFAEMVVPATDLSPNGMAGCLLWTGKPAKGYGRIRVGANRARKAMHVALELAGRPLADGLVPDHLCRRTMCVNVEHLEPVTNAENIRRGAVAKLNAEQAQEIRSLMAAGWQQCDVARAYGVADASVHRIANGTTWAVAA